MKPGRTLCHPLLWSLAGVAALLGCSSRSGTSNEHRADIFVVQRGDLPIRVTEQAEIQPSQSTRIKNEMEGQSTIIFLIEEGRIVAKGEKLIELDASELLERRAQQAIATHRAAAEATGAQKELDIRRKEFEAEKLGGENLVRIGEIDLEKFLGKLKRADLSELEKEAALAEARTRILGAAFDVTAASAEGDAASDPLTADRHREMGERLQQLVDAQANIKLAEQEVKLAKNKWEWSRKLQEKSFITMDELERDELDHQRAQKDLQVSRNELEILIQFTHPKELIKLEQAVREAQTGLEGILARGDARIAQALADLEAKQKEHELAEERLANLERQIENAVIKAPAPGLVVYASEGGNRGRQEIVEEGMTVRERQTLIELPDVSKLNAELSVHEAVVDKVRPGQRALIKIDAVAGAELTGIVKRVSPVADSGSRWTNNGLKVYKTEVEIEGENLGLRPNLSATVTIIVADLDDVLYVPLQAVRRQGAVPFVWLESPTGPVARPVELGVNDFQFVEVAGGLEPGDRVYLATPPEAVEPEFAQPKETLVAAAADPQAVRPADAVSREAQPPRGDENGDEVGGRFDGPGREDPSEAGGTRGVSPAMAKVQELLDRKYPDLAEVVKQDRRAWFDNDALRQALEQDEELRAARDEMMRELRERGGRRGERGRGERGERRGGTGDEENAGRR